MGVAVSLIDGLLSGNFTPGGDLSGSADSQQVVGINGATAPARPTSADVGKVIIATAPGVYALQVPADAAGLVAGSGVTLTTVGATTVISENPATRTIAAELVKSPLNADRDGTIDFVGRYATHRANNVPWDIVISEATWGGTGQSDAAVYQQFVRVSVEIVSETSTFAPYSLTFTGLLRKGTFGGTTVWGIGVGLSENSALRVPVTFNPATAGACTASMSLSGGTDNGDIIVTVTPTGGGDTVADLSVKVSIFGGGRFHT